MEVPATTVQLPYGLGIHPVDEDGVVWLSEKDAIAVLKGDRARLERGETIDQDFHVGVKPTVLMRVLQAVEQWTHATRLSLYDRSRNRMYPHSLSATPHERPSRARAAP